MSFRGKSKSLRQMTYSLNHPKLIAVRRQVETAIRIYFVNGALARSDPRTLRKLTASPPPQATARPSLGNVLVLVAEALAKEEALCVVGTRSLPAMDSCEIHRCRDCSDAVRRSWKPWRSLLLRLFQQAGRGFICYLLFAMHFAG